MGSGRWGIVSASAREKCCFRAANTFSFRTSGLRLNDEVRWKRIQSKQTIVQLQQNNIHRPPLVELIIRGYWYLLLLYYHYCCYYYQYYHHYLCWNHRYNLQVIIQLFFLIFYWTNPRKFPRIFENIWSNTWTEVNKKKLLEGKVCRKVLKSPCPQLLWENSDVFICSHTALCRSFLTNGKNSPRKSKDNCCSWNT